MASSTIPFEYIFDSQITLSGIAHPVWRLTRYHTARQWRLPSFSTGNTSSRDYVVVIDLRSSSVAGDNISCPGLPCEHGTDFIYSNLLMPVFPLPVGRLLDGDHVWIRNDAHGAEADDHLFFYVVRLN